MNKDEIEKKIKRVKAGGNCQDRRRLSNESDVVAWIEPSGQCNGLTSADLYFACTNRSYFSFEVTFAIETSHGAIDVGSPTKGQMFVPPPSLDAIEDFNWDFAPIARKLVRRKDDCVIRWSVRDVPSLVPTVNIVSVVTEP